MLDGLRTLGGYGIMRRFLRAPAGSGFTVIEVMIVLAVSGLLFVSAAVLISGKQNQTAFSQSVRQVHAQIQQVVNEVSTGFYPNTGSIQCTAGGGNVVLTNAAGVEQGANAGCVFLGKAIQFQLTGTDPEELAIYSIAGLQKGGVGGAETATLSEARPKTIAPSSAETTLPNATVKDSLQNGLTTYRMWYNNGGVDRPVGLVAFTSGLAQVTSGGGLVSGSQQVQVVPIDDNGIKSALGKTTTDGADVINSNLATSPLNPTRGVFLCFVSGGTDQSGLITIGNEGRQLSVKLDIKSNRTCS